jgi:hypothetical protein
MYEIDVRERSFFMQETEEQSAPVRLGVFLSNAHKMILKRKVKDHKRYRFMELLASEAAKAGDTVIFFSPEDVVMGENIIKNALYYDIQAKKWKLMDSPLPTVVYERIYTRNGLVTKVRRGFKGKGIPSINNQASFDKYDTYKKLQGIEKAAPYLPPTINVHSFNDIRRFLLKYKTVYLKKVHSSLGKGVVKVQYRNSRSFEFSHFRSRLRNRSVSNMNKLKRPLSQFFKKKKFIAQQAIDLITLNGCNVDFRAEVQRTGEQITIGGIAARVGLKRSPITVHSTAMPAEIFFESELGYSEKKVKEVVDEIEAFLKTIYFSLEEAYGNFGEIGIDFGIDNKGRIWLIEANSKSAKVSFEKSYGQDGLKENAGNLLKYARYLTEGSAEKK